MEMQSVWGQHLRKHRIRTGLTQSEFAEAASKLTLECSSEKERQLQKAGIEHLVIANYDLSRYENGRRTPRDRSRHLAFIWALYKLGGLHSVEEANQWLLDAELAPLTTDQMRAIFDIEQVRMRKEYSSDDANSTRLTMRWASWLIGLMKSSKSKIVNFSL